MAKLITALPRTLEDYEKNIYCKDEGMNHEVPKLAKKNCCLERLRSMSTAMTAEQRKDKKQDDK